MAKPTNNKTPTEKRSKLKKRRLGVSKLGFVETVPREIADAEIAKLFEGSKLFPDDE